MLFFFTGEAVRLRVVCCLVFIVVRCGRFFSQKIDRNGPIRRNGVIKFQNYSVRNMSAIERVRSA